MKAETQSRAAQIALPFPEQNHSSEPVHTKEIFRPMNERHRQSFSSAMNGARMTGSRTVPGPILLMGASGVGKGTQAKELGKLWGIPKISTGDLFRANVSQGTELGKIAKEIMQRGELVPDTLVNEMVAVRLKQPDTAAGYMLDGFPRTLPQAAWLDGRLASQPQC